MSLPTSYRSVSRTIIAPRSDKVVWGIWSSGYFQSAKLRMWAWKKACCWIRGLLVFRTMSPKGARRRAKPGEKWMKDGTVLRMRQKEGLIGFGIFYVDHWVEMGFQLPPGLICWYMIQLIFLLSGSQAALGKAVIVYLLNQALTGWFKCAYACVGRWREFGWWNSTSLHVRSQGLTTPIMQLMKGAYGQAQVTTTKHLQVCYHLLVRWFLKADMVVRMDSRDWNEKLMNKLSISLHLCQ